MSSIIDRPFMLHEIAMAFDTPISRVEGLVRRHRIDPIMRAGRTRLYGPSEIRAIYSLLNQATA
jgi:hypothetical protein